jgi:hypothetical protein
MTTSFNPTTNSSFIPAISSPFNSQPSDQNPTNKSPKNPQQFTPPIPKILSIFHPTISDAQQSLQVKRHSRKSE